MNKRWLYTLITLSSCTLGPRKELPPIDLPTEYSQKQAQAEDSIGALSDWWEQFHDPLLSELIQIGMEKNFELRTALEQIEQSRASMAAANSKLFPTLDFFGALARIKFSKDLVPTIPVPGFASTIRNFFVSGFDATWELDFFGKNQSNKEQAYYNFLASGQHANFIQITITAEIARIYTEIRSLQQRQILQEKRVKTFETLLNLTENLKNAGLKNSIDIEKKISEFNELKSWTPLLQKAIEQSIGDLSLLLGGILENHKKKLEIPQKIPQSVGKVPIGIPSDLLKRRPDIQQAENVLYACGASIGAAKADLFPSIALTGLLGTAGHTFQSGKQFWAAIPTINWSLFQGGKVLANIQIANSQQKIALISYEKTVKSALNEVENSLVGYFQTALRTEDLHHKCLAEKKLLDLSQSLFESGLSDLQSVLNRYETFFSSQEEYLEAREKNMLNLISLYKSLGGGY